MVISEPGKHASHQEPFRSCISENLVILNYKCGHFSKIMGQRKVEGRGTVDRVLLLVNRLIL